MDACAEFKFYMLTNRQRGTHRAKGGQLNQRYLSICDISTSKSRVLSPSLQNRCLMSRLNGAMQQAEFFPVKIQPTEVHGVLGYSHGISKLSKEQPQPS